MDKAKHTPAPWGFDDECGIISDNAVIAQAHPQQYYGEDSFDWDTAFANARLIAAAPELLEALEDARGYIAAEAFNAKDSKKARNYSEAVDRIDAAIAKATGA